MVCYVVPLAASIIHAVSRKKISSWRNNIHHKWLNLLFVGGAIFGIMDHIWNGELFLIGENIRKDLLLGVTITLAILTIWVITVIASKANPTLTSYLAIEKE